MRTKRLVITIPWGCARCGRAHRNLSAKAFRRPQGRFTHWVPCPRTKEPILVRVLRGRS